jgi:hypothetical protein
MAWRVPIPVETFCLVNMINTNITKIYVDGKQALTYCQSVILPIHPFILAVSSVNLLLTAEEHSSLLARRVVAGPPSGCTFDRTGRATPKRDCCRQLHASTVSNSCHCNNGHVMTLPFPQAKEMLFCFWLANHAL